jgi:flagellar basal-body rod modification protein FlgD
MAVDAIGAAVGSGLGNVQRAGVSQDDFLKIFLTQLSFQDPLEPVDNREFLAQLAQFSSVEQLRQTKENLDGLLSMQASSQAVGLLGRTVEVASASQAPAVGTVTTVSFRTGKPLLTIKLGDGTFLQDLTPTEIRLVR